MEKLWLLTWAVVHFSVGFRLRELSEDGRPSLSLNWNESLLVGVEKVSEELCAKNLFHGAKTRMK